MNTENNAPKRHHYVDCGLDNVWIEGGFDEIDSPYGVGVAIHDLEGLHRCIANCLVSKPAPLTGPEFKFLRTELDLSQLALGSLCGRNERTIREWETRDVPVEEPANTLVRFVHQQRFHPLTSYEELSKTIKHLQVLDKTLHELKLRSTSEGWKPVDCQGQRAA